MSKLKFKFGNEQVIVMRDGYCLGSFTKVTSGNWYYEPDSDGYIHDSKELRQIAKRLDGLNGVVRPKTENKGDGDDAFATKPKTCKMGAVGVMVGEVRYPMSYQFHDPSTLKIVIESPNYIFRAEGTIHPDNCQVELIKNPEPFGAIAR